MTGADLIPGTWKIFVIFADPPTEPWTDDPGSFDVVAAAAVDAVAGDAADVECSDDQSHDAVEADLATFPADAVHEDVEDVPDLSETQDDLRGHHLPVLLHLLQSWTTRHPQLWLIILSEEL